MLLETDASNPEDESLGAFSRTAGNRNFVYFDQAGLVATIGERVDGCAHKPRGEDRLA
ncbi:MAG: hypothetical protein GY725_09260 [bacterium]|nr:hypothetical protein [bacterium]